VHARWSSENSRNTPATRNTIDPAWPRCRRKKPYGVLSAKTPPHLRAFTVCIACAFTRCACAWSEIRPKLKISLKKHFLVVYRKIRTFRGDSAFSTWLHRIAVNLFLMGQRRKTSMESSFENHGEPGTNRAVTHDEPAGADLTLAGSLDRLNLERAMKKLGPSQRLVFVLHDIQGYKHTEIAKILHWSIGNSKSRLHRARAQLRTLLQEGVYFGCIAPSPSAQPAFSA
jgi:RNA polymerase sigma factor (sigma-70 family)